VNWISVKDRLPDLHDEVWEDGETTIHYQASDPCLCVFNTNEQIVAACEIDNDQDGAIWVSVFDGNVLQTVTHWMPLPTLPSEVTAHD